MADNPGSNANSTSPPSTVPWNTIFFTLVPLATSVMAQPAGSILGTAPISRTYLRSSPLFCAIDTLSLLTNVSLYRLLLSTSWKSAFFHVIRDRFEEIVYEGEGIQAFERTAFLRWVLFLLGTLGSVFKIATAKGLPWTKAWGLMFFVSFLVFEGMVFFSRKADEGEYELQVSAAKYPRVVFIRHTVTLARYLAILCHLALLFYAVIQISTIGPRPAHNTLLSKSQVIYSSSVTGLWEFVPLLCYLTMSIGSIWLLTQHGHFLQFSLILLPTAGIGAYLFVLQVQQDTIHRGGILVLSTVSGLYLLGVLACKLAIRFPHVAEKLLMSDPQRRIGLRSGDLETELHVWPLVGFVANVVFALLWYSMRYDAKGTSNAGWTGVFS